MRKVYFTPFLSLIINYDEGGPTPIPAAPGTQVSTSSDINAYVGRKRSNNDTNNNNNNNDSCDNINNNEKRNSKVLILDSEGVNGSNTCSEVLSRRNRLLPQCMNKKERMKNNH